MSGSWQLHLAGGSGLNAEERANERRSHGQSATLFSPVHPFSQFQIADTCELPTAIATAYCDSQQSCKEINHGYDV